MKVSKSLLIFVLNDRWNGDGIMSILEANLSLIATIPEERQEEIQKYLLLNFCGNNPYKPMSADVDFQRIARLTSGLAGADIENMLNELNI